MNDKDLDKNPSDVLETKQDQTISIVEDIEEKLDKLDKHQLKSNIKTQDITKSILESVKRCNKATCVSAVGTGMLAVAGTGLYLNEKLNTNGGDLKSLIESIKEKPNNITVKLEQGCNTCGAQLAPEYAQRDMGLINGGLEDLKRGLAEEYSTLRRLLESSVQHINDESSVLYMNLNELIQRVRTVERRLDSVDLGQLYDMLKEYTDQAIKTLRNYTITQEQKHIASFGSKISEIEKNLSAFKRQITQIENNVKDKILEEVKQYIDTKLKPHEERITKLENKQEEVEKLIAQTKKLQEEFNNLCKEYEGLNESLTNMFRQVQQALNDKVEDLESKVDELDTNLGTLMIEEGDFDDLKNKVDEHSQKISEVESKMLEFTPITEIQKLQQSQDDLSQSFVAWMGTFTNVYKEQEKNIQNLMRSNAKLEELLAL